MQRGTLAGIALFALLLGAIATSIWWGTRWWLEDELRPEVAAMLQPQGVALAPDKNLFFGLLGAASQGDGELAERGQRIWADYQARRAAGKSAELIPAEQQFAFGVDDKLICELRALLSDRCVKQRQDNHETIRATLHEARELLLRYQSLTRYRQFHSPMLPALESPPLPYQLLLQGKRLFLTELLLDARQSSADSQTIAARWQGDLDFWLSLLGSPHGDLMTRMVAVAGVQASFLSALELASEHTSNVMIASLENIPTDAFSMRSAMTAEFRAMADLHQNLLGKAGIFEMFRTARVGDTTEPEAQRPSGALSRRLAKWVYLPNDTTHRAHDDLFSHFSNRDAYSCPTPESAESPAPDQDWRRKQRFHNPVGKTLSQLAQPAYSGYFDRVCDLEGVRRAMLIHLQAKQLGIPAQEMPAFVAGLSAKLHDPYSREPMQWDAEQEGLRFAARGTRVQELLPL